LVGGPPPTFLTHLSYEILFSIERLDMYKDETEKQTEILNSILAELSSDVEGSDIPLYVISGSGVGWFLDPESCQMVKMNRGTEIVPLGPTADENDKMLVRAPFRFLLIPEEEVQEIGWN